MQRSFKHLLYAFGFMCGDAKQPHQVKHGCGVA
jgi:hypothetical protein